MPRALHPSTPMQDLEARRNWTGPVLAGVLTEEIARFCQSGVSVVLAARLPDGRPIAGLALACRINLEGDIFVFLRKPANDSLIAAIGTGSAIAATFTEPRTHRSIQIKGDSAQMVALASGDRDLIAHQNLIFRDGLAIVADHFGAIYALLQQDEAPIEAVPPPPARIDTQSKLAIRYYPADASVFLNRDYLIKGVAGAIFWKLVREYVQDGRSEFTNRELRLDPVLRLPQFAENLEARLVLLHRRLAERSADVRIEKCGRGRFRLVAARELVLEETDALPAKSVV